MKQRPKLCTQKRRCTFKPLNQSIQKGQHFCMVNKIYIEDVTQKANLVSAKSYLKPKKNLEKIMHHLYWFQSLMIWLLLLDNSGANTIIIVCHLLASQLCSSKSLLPLPRLCLRMAAHNFLFFFFNRLIKHQILRNFENGGYQNDLTDVLTTNKQIL